MNYYEEIKEEIIKEYSRRLTNEFSKGYTPTRLKYYRRFYNVFLKSPTMSDVLTYSHYCEIIWLDEHNLTTINKFIFE